MGIGKTVQSIACALAHPPSKKALHAFRGATLIIVPNKGLALQWEKELLEHGKITSREVCKYGGKMGALAIRGYPYVYVQLPHSRMLLTVLGSQRIVKSSETLDCTPAKETMRKDLCSMLSSTVSSLTKVTISGTTMEAVRAMRKAYVRIKSTNADDSL